MSFLSKERIMAQKGFREMDNFFGQRAPRHQSKMTVFHLKPSYLNWRVILYMRRKSYIFMQSSFLTFFLNLAFLIFVWTWSNFSSASYDNQIIFFCFCFFFHDLSTLGNNAYHRFLSRLKHHFSCRNCFERVIFWSKVCSCHSYPKKGLWLKSVPEKWTIFFLVNVFQDINQGWFWNIMVLWLVFLVIEKKLTGSKL